MKIANLIIKSYLFPDYQFSLILSALSQRMCNLITEKPHRFFPMELFKLPLFIYEMLRFYSAEKIMLIVALTINFAACTTVLLSFADAISIIPLP